MACYFSANKKYVPNQPRYSSHTDESPEKSSNICCVYKSRFRKTTPTFAKFQRMGNMRQGALNRRQLYCQYLASRSFAFTPDESLETNNTACLCENRANLPKIGSVFLVGQYIATIRYQTLLPHKRALKWRQITCYWVWNWSFWLLIYKMLHILTSKAETKIRLNWYKLCLIVFKSRYTVKNIIFLIVVYQPVKCIELYCSTNESWLVLIIFVIVLLTNKIQWTFLVRPMSRSKLIISVILLGANKIQGTIVLKLKTVNNSLFTSFYWASIKFKVSF